MNKPTLLLIGNHLSETKSNQNVWNELALQLKTRGYGVITTSSKQNKYIRLMDMLYTILTKRREYAIAQIDVFSGQAFYFALVCTFLLQILSKPIVLTLHGGNLPQLFKTSPGMVQRLFSNVTAVIAPSNYLYDAFKHCRINIHLIPNAIDIDLYPFHQREKILPNLIWLRAFHSVYNPELAIYVLARVLSVFPDAHLTMIGPDKSDNSLKKAKNLARSLGIEKSVDFHGPVTKNEVPKFLSKADIFLNTTNIDNTPISVIEAMACGLCIVSTNVGGIPSLVKNNFSGLLVEPGDPNAMAESVIQLLMNPDLSSSVSSQARNEAMAFSWNAVLGLWEELLADILNLRNE